MFLPKRNSSFNLLTCGEDIFRVILGWERDSRFYTFRLRQYFRNLPTELRKWFVPFREPMLVLITVVGEVKNLEDRGQFCYCCLKWRQCINSGARYSHSAMIIRRAKVECEIIHTVVYCTGILILSFQSYKPMSKGALSHVTCRLDFSIQFCAVSPTWNLKISIQDVCQVEFRVPFPPISISFFFCVRIPFEIMPSLNWSMTRPNIILCPPHQMHFE